MNWSDLSNAATTADHYSEWMPMVSADGVYLTQENRKHTEEVIKELHDAINKVPIDDIPEMLSQMDVHKTTVISLMSNSVIKIVETFIDVIGSDCLCDIEDKFDPCVDDALEFFVKLLPVLEQQLQVLEQRFAEEPTDADKKAQKNLQKYIVDGKFKSMDWDRFLHSVLLKNVFGIGVVRRLNYLLNNCSDEGTRLRLADYLQEYQQQKAQEQVIATARVDAAADHNKQRPTQEPSTDRAKKAFAAAVKAGYMEKTDLGYRWLYNRGSKASLSYFLVQVYSHDNSGATPFKALEQLFGFNRLDSAADKAIANAKKPQAWRNEIDALLKEL